MRSLLLRVLAQAAGPLTPSDLRDELQKLGERSDEGLILQVLRLLSREGFVRLEGGVRWRLLKLPDAAESAPIQDEGRDRRGGVVTPGMRTVGLHSEHPEAAKRSEPTGRWALFRRLCRYYNDCLLQEDAPQLKSYIDNQDDTWIQLPQVPWERLASEQSFATVLSLDQAAFTRSRARRGNDDSLFLGYPLNFVKPTAQSGFLVPIFVQPMEADWRAGALTLKPDGPITVNGAWMGYHFKQRNERESFLRAMGFLGDVDEEEDEREARVPLSFAGLATQAAHYLHDRERFAQPIEPFQLRQNVDWASARPGFHNVAVLALGPRLRYTRGLIKDLSRIELEFSDEQLDQTALAHVFPHDAAPPGQQGITSAGRSESTPGGSINNSNPGPRARPDPPAGVKADSEGERWMPQWVAHPRMLQGSQKRAVESAIAAPVSVITGPPGTGKSEVVVAILLNQALRARTALFASKNHQALEAVIPRLNSFEDGGELVVQASARDLAMRRNYLQKLRQLLARPPHRDTDDGDEFLRRLSERFREQQEAADGLARLAQAGETYGQLNARFDAYLKDLPEKGGDPEWLLRWPQGIGDLQLEQWSNELRNTLKPPENLLGRLWRWVFQARYRARLEAARSALLSLPNPFEDRPLPENGAPIEAWDDLLRAWAAWCGASLLHPQLKKCESIIAALPTAEKFTTILGHSQSEAEGATRQWMAWAANGLPGVMEAAEREALSNIRAGIQTWGEARFAKNLRDHFPIILKAFPLWSVSNLSAKSTLPLVPGLFDLVVIDEACQCDVASVIPLLARSRRVAFVGDPNQLNHICNLDVSMDQALLQQNGLTELSVQRFGYRTNSAFDLGDASSSVPDCARVLLNLHFRSHSHIADYCNEAFYSKALHVVTASDQLKIPKGKRPGIHWSDVKGVVQPGPTGAWCEEEISAVRQELRALATQGYEGTIGVVTPFKHQMNRLKDTLDTDPELPAAFRDRVQLHIATINGFQGGERDLMFFSLCGGRDMPTGAATFFRENRNLFNVAVSRARAVLHIVGDREWALDCGLDYIKKLAARTLASEPAASPTTQKPYQSPWEEKLADALSEVGIAFVPQYPVAGRYLDLAILTPLKIDIEVDGEAFHRTGGGGRKDDDHWRDLQMQSLGWKVFRFWVYQLRESMNDCVARVQNALAEGHRSPKD